MTRPRRVIKRGLRLERWRIVAWFRYFRDYGSPRFEFEFRFGRPAPLPLPELDEDDFT